MKKTNAFLEQAVHAEGVNREHTHTLLIHHRDHHAPGEKPDAAGASRGHRLCEADRKSHREPTCPVDQLSETGTRRHIQYTAPRGTA